MALNATLTPFPADLDVREVRFSDRMNQPFDLVVKGASTASNLDLRGLLGHRITLSLPDEALLSSIHGIVRRAGMSTPEPSGVTVYELQIAPAEWVLAKRTNSRIFQKLTATEILQALLREHPITTNPAVFTRALAIREYCVQYDETDLDFASRLLAEEGIAAYFDQAAGGRWTLVDDTTLQKPPEARAVVHANAANLRPGAPAVLRWRAEETVETIAAARRDYDFERPNLTLEQAAAPRSALSATETSLESYTYEPDRLLHAGDDGKQAARDLEAARALSSVVHLETNFAVGAGGSLHIDGDDLAGSWFVTGADVLLQSSPAGGGGLVTTRAISLSAVPLAVPYRPLHRRRPLIFGTQSARVVGATPEGTVDVDEHGRVNIELRWDRRELWRRGAPGKENPTRRVRVAQAWAGAGYGFVTLPRVGDEVLLAYEDGNPDRPVVIGRLHNAVSPTPLDLPEAQKTISVWKSQSFGPNGPVEGSNSIAMEDAAGAEVLQVVAQRDFAALVGRDAMTTIGADDTKTIGGNQMLTVEGSQTIRIGGKRNGSAGGGAGGTSAVTPDGAQIVNVTGAYSLNAKGVTLDSRDTMGLHSAKDMRLDCDADRTDNSIHHHIFADASIYVSAQLITVSGKTVQLVSESGSSSIEITDGGITIKSSGPIEIDGNPIKLNC